MPKSCFLDSLLAAEISKYNDIRTQNFFSTLFLNDSPLNRWFSHHVLRLVIGDLSKGPLLGGAIPLAVKAFSNEPHSKSYPERFLPSAFISYYIERLLGNALGNS